MKAAWNIVGVVVVLALAAVAVPVSAQIKEGAKNTKDGVVKIAKGVGEGTKEALSKTGEVMTDAWITTRVHERFVGQELLKNSDIDVDTDKHVVTLKGTVTNGAGRRKATTIAQRTEGVHRVVNHLTIGPKKD